MNKLVHKQVLPALKLCVFGLSLPKWSSILKVGLQNGALCMWYIFDEDMKQELETRTFHIARTGIPFDLDNGRYIDTIQDGACVWHIFEAAL